MTYMDGRGDSPLYGAIGEGRAWRMPTPIPTVRLAYRSHTVLPVFPNFTAAV